ncbi:MAG TPA: HD domain-containing protein [Blastocatellia bacterium]|nr:HD domain-containing protein [Blastocatellia bacterium]
MDYERKYEYLAERLQPHLMGDELTQVRLAYEVAEAAHEGQMRDEGTPYILHPVRVAVSLVDELEIYSPRLVSSALLHDVIEDSPITRRQIAELFGDDVAEIVWLLTKFDDVSLPAYLSAIEAASDTGAAIVKLCDRLDNLRFLAHSPRAEKKRRYIHTTEAFYLSMAARTNKYLYDELSRWLEEARNHVRAEAGGRGSGISDL